jgi:DNA polymerase elongation subunit (family B)
MEHYSRSAPILFYSIKNSSYQSPTLIFEIKHYSRSAPILSYSSIEYYSRSAPYGEDLYYYDVNSLYPSAMARNSMPIGKPTWVGNLSNHNLEDIYGFVEAFVHCPKSMNKPLLPYRQEDGSLVFPTGRFYGVFYSEELKKAKEVGYTVEPLKGYLYQKGEGLFNSFVETLHEKRSQAKKDGKVGMSFVFKILMNSLYGRFGINLGSTVTELCTRERHYQLEQGRLRVVSALPLTNKTILCSYWSEPEDGSCDWFRKLGAVQIAAAITSHARIYMYEFISREDCYYTDTDSVVLKNRLPPDIICNYTLGKFKLEHKVKEGYFLSPKSYSLTTDKEEVKLVHKGAAKPHVTSKWFEEQLLDEDKKINVKVTNTFRVDKKKMEVKQVVTEHTLGLPATSRRVKIYNKDNIWVDTKPIHIELKVHPPTPVSLLSQPGGHVISFPNTPKLCEYR